MGPRVRRALTGLLNLCPVVPSRRHRASLCQSSQVPGPCPCRPGRPPRDSSETASGLPARTVGGGHRAGWVPWPSSHALPLSPLQALALLLLSVPRALSSRAQLYVPLGLPVSSLLFYLLLLALLATHVTVCTSAESTCYFCSFPWPAAGGVMALISGLLCAVVSALTEMSADAEHLRKVMLVSARPAVFLDGHSLGPLGLSLTGIGWTLACPRHSAGGGGPKGRCCPVPCRHAALCVAPRPSSCLESRVPLTHAAGRPPAEGSVPTGAKSDTPEALPRSFFSRLDVFLQNSWSRSPLAPSLTSWRGWETPSPRLVPASQGLHALARPRLSRQGPQAPGARAVYSTCTQCTGHRAPSTWCPCLQFQCSQLVNVRDAL